MHRVPGYQDWYESIDATPAYRWHRQHLQYLQWRCRGQRWVLKSPGHLWTLDALLAVYPDARIIHMHRDPVQVLASLSSLISHMRRMTSRTVDDAEIGRDWAPRLQRGLESAIAARERAAIAEDRVIDVNFADLMGREIETIREIYRRFGFAWSAEGEDRMRRQLREQPKDKHGRHRYRLEQFGLARGEERARFARYCTHFGIAEEAPGS
jgi:hypothetical protein